MKRNSTERLLRKRTEFANRLHVLYPDIELNRFTGKPLLAIRRNTLKASALTVEGVSISWAPNCFLGLQPRSILTRMPEHETGDVYLQNPSSFIPPLALDPKEGDRILDVCAAPGGKASHVAALAANRCELWVNDSSKGRLLRMQRNLERLGVIVHNATLLAAEKLSRELQHGYFNKILLDAPCSGEGALNFNDDESMQYWSTAHIRRLQSLQKQMISSAWQLLAPGGTLVYSTCTTAPEENEAVIDWLLSREYHATIEPITLAIPSRVPAVMKWGSKLFDETISDCMRIKPNDTMEAFFVTKLIKEKH